MEEKIKTKQAVHYNEWHTAKEPRNVLPGDGVYISNCWENVVIVKKTPELRSNQTETNNNASVRQNWWQLTPNPKDTALPPWDSLQSSTVNSTGQT